MKIIILDKKTMGDDTPFNLFDNVGDVISYDYTSTIELVSRISEAEVVITNKVKVTAEAIRSAKNLKLICVFATGFDTIDIAAAREKGVGVCNVPGYSTDSVALFTISTALALITHLPEYNDFVRSGEYSNGTTANKLTPVYHELNGKTWGIIGFGNIGRAVAKVANALGANVIVNKRTPVEDFRFVDIDTLCRESDIISIHCPLNDETRGMINKSKINLMKDGVILVNEARGAVTDENDVAEAVLSGKISGFGCDVYSTEPFGERHPYTKIMGLKNVILTPHAAWGAYEARKKCVEIICKNIQSFENGEKLNRVD